MSTKQQCYLHIANKVSVSNARQSMSLYFMAQFGLLQLYYYRLRYVVTVTPMQVVAKFL